jgi:hypothetical protein
LINYQKIIFKAFWAALNAELYIYQIMIFLADGQSGMDISLRRQRKQRLIS